VKVGYKAGGNREEEIRGNHAFEIDENVKGRVGGFVDTLIEGNETRSVNGSSELNVQNYYELVAHGDIWLTAFDNIETLTVSGITSFMSGDKLNMKSAAAMDIKTEADGLTIYSEGLVTETFKASHTNNTTGTLDLNVSVEVDIDSALINLN